jgi:hypothetical protein
MPGKKGARTMPRLRLLPSCLALALAAGSTERVAADAAQRSIPPADADRIGASLGRHGAPRLSKEQQRTLFARAWALHHTPPVAPASSIPVTNCDDSGPGSYRDAMTNAVSGDTIDLTNTGCSVISLTTGDVATAADDLTLQGPSALLLTISGGYHYRPLEHVGFGTLSINDLSISEGLKYVADGGTGSPNGGCVYSGGVADLSYSLIKYCSVTSADYTRGAHGGGVFGENGVVLVGSTILGNSAESIETGAYGGGVYTPGYLDVFNSTIRSNYVHSGSLVAVGGAAAVGDTFLGGGGAAAVKYSSIEDNSVASADLGGEGGGLYFTGDVDIENTTISGNVSGSTAGGVFLVGSPSVTRPWSILDSTIANNSSTRYIAGLLLGANASVISNTTIAFNQAHGSHLIGAGLYLGQAVDSDLESTLISGNTTDPGSGPVPDDVGGTSGATLSGANNLIFALSLLTAPADTLVGQNPLLGSLADNGGATATISISPLSPALDAGNNNAGVTTDQRGTGFAREVGAAPDIGAIEIDISDVIFANGFD